MTNGDLPHGLIPNGASRTFTETSLPAAFCKEHSLRAGRWGLLEMLEGSVWFIDAKTGTEQHLQAPCTWTIRPEETHRLRLDGQLQFRIAFYDEAPSEPA